MPYHVRSSHAVATVSPPPAHPQAYPRRVTWAEVEQRTKRCEARLLRSARIFDAASVVLTKAEARLDRPPPRSPRAAARDTR